MFVEAICGDLSWLAVDDTVTDVADEILTTGLIGSAKSSSGGRSGRSGTVRPTALFPKVYQP